MQRVRLTGTIASLSILLEKSKHDARPTISEVVGIPCQEQFYGK